MTVIDHEGVFYTLANFIITVCCLVSSYLYLFQAAFRIYPESASGSSKSTSILSDSLDKFERSGTEYTLFICSISFEILFLIDMLSKFTLSYTDESIKKKIETHYKIR